MQRTLNNSNFVQRALDRWTYSVTLDGVTRSAPPYEVPLESIRTAQISERLYGPTTLPTNLTEWLTEPHYLSECRDRDLVSQAIVAALEWLGSFNSLWRNAPRTAAPDDNDPGERRGRCRLRTSAGRVREGLVFEGV